MLASHRPALGIGGGRRTFAAVALCAATAFALAVPSVVVAAECAATTAEACKALTAEARAALTAQCLTNCGLLETVGGAKIETTRSVSQITGTVIQAALSLIGVVFLILMIYGGIRWMTARGESGNVEEAQKIIKAAITGIIIVALAFAITKFIIDKLGSAAG